MNFVLSDLLRFCNSCDFCSASSFIVAYLCLLQFSFMVKLFSLLMSLVSCILFLVYQRFFCFVLCYHEDYKKHYAYNEVIETLNSFFDV